MLKNKSGKTKILLGFIMLIVLTSSFYFIFQDSIRIDIQETKTIYKIYENDKWVLAGTEYSKIYDGSKLMRAKDRVINYTIENNISDVWRYAYFKDNITLIDYYQFDGDIGNIESFPKNHTIICINCEGKIVHYEIRDILYEGETKEINSPFSFGHNMKIEWQSGNYYSKVFQQKYASDKIIIKYRPKSDYETYSVRLFDPPFYRYNFTSREVILDNSRIKLNTPQINYVMRGSDRLVAEFTINNQKISSNVFNKLEFYDVKNNMNKIDREFTYRYKTYNYVVVPDYEIVCEEKISGNGSMEKYNCVQNQIGSYIRQDTVWNDFNENDDLSEGNITIGVFTDVYAGDNIEWIPTLFGVRINEWAVWTEGLKIGLLSYWNFDEVSGTAFDSLGIRNATPIDVDQGVPGIRNKGISVSTNGQMDANNSLINNLQNHSISMWVKRIAHGNDYPRLFLTGTVNTGITIAQFDTGQNIYYGLEDLSILQTTSNPLQNNVWVHLVLTFNGSQRNIYKNGTLIAQLNESGTVGEANGALMHIGGEVNSWFNGTIDEVALWNRSLTESEALDLYNNGTGIFYVVTPPEVNITFPMDGVNYSYLVTELNYTVYDPFDLDSCWYSLNLGETNTTITCGENVSGLSSGEGYNNWTIYANDSFGNEVYNTSKFLVDLYVPTIDFRLSASQNNTWITTTNITANINVNETNPKNVTYTLFNSSEIVVENISFMNNELSNITFSFTGVADGSYFFNVSMFDVVNRFNTTETRTVYLDSTYPLINFTSNSDTTNISTNFSIKNNIFVNVSVTEINEENITFILWTYFGTQNETTFTDSTRVINWTDLDESMYFWNVTVCDQAGQCNTTETRNYGNIIINLTMNNLTENLNVELGTNISLNVSNTFDLICLDIDHPDYGANYSCSTQWGFLDLFINFFRRTTIPNGTDSITFDMNQPGFNVTNLTITSHQYDEVDGFSVNISGTNNPRDVTFYKCNTIDFDRVFAGELHGSNIFLQNFSNLTGNTLGPGYSNISFGNRGNLTVYFFLDDNAKLINVTMNVSGFSRGLEFFDPFDNFSLIDTDLTTAHLSPEGVIMLANSSLIYNVYDDYDSSIDERWLTSSDAYSTISEAGNYIRAKINQMSYDVVGTSQGSFVTAIMNNGTSLYTSDHYDFRLVGQYRALEDNCNSDGTSAINFGGVTIFTSMNLDLSSGASDTEQSDADVHFYLDKINKTAWKVNITGSETSNVGDWSSNPGCEATRVNNWTKGEYNITSGTPACNLNGSLSNIFYVNPDYTSTYPIEAVSTGVSSSNCLLTSVTTDVYAINRTLYSRDNSTVMSKSVYDTASDISQATLNYSLFTQADPTYETAIFFLSADNGANWEAVSIGALHTFTNKGTHLKWRMDYNTTFPGYVNVSLFLTNISITSPAGSPVNLSFDFGDDGINDALISGSINETNGSIIIDMSSANISSSFTELRDLYDHTYEIPLRISSDSHGDLKIDAVNITYNPNPIVLNETFIQSCVANETDNSNFTIVIGSYGGNITINDIIYDYAGGNDTIEILAHTSDYTQNITYNITYFYSRWDYLFGPSSIEWLFFNPSSPTSKNVTPYGQTSGIPIFNITNYGYGGLNSDLTFYVNDSESCVDMFLSTNNTKPSSSLWDGLIGHWPFDLDARDLSGNSNDGTVINATFISQGGQLSGAYEFDGDDGGYVEVSDDIQGGVFDTPENGTYSAWVNLYSWGVRNHMIVGQGFREILTSPESSIREGVQTAILGSIQNLSVGISGDASPGGDVINIDYTDYLAKWTHVTMTWNLTNIGLYVNGELEDSVTRTNKSNGTITEPSTPFRIGRDKSDTSTQDFNGTIDEVRIYNRTLGSGEVSELYTRQSNKYFDTKLQEDWQTVMSNRSYLDVDSFWLWTDYECNYTSWQLFNPYFYFRQCCDNCICSEGLY